MRGRCASRLRHSREPRSGTLSVFGAEAWLDDHGRVGSTLDSGLRVGLAGNPLSNRLGFSPENGDRAESECGSLPKSPGRHRRLRRLGPVVERQPKTGGCFHLKTWPGRSGSCTRSLSGANAAGGAVGRARIWAGGLYRIMRLPRRRWRLTYQGGPLRIGYQYVAALPAAGPGGGAGAAMAVLVTVGGSARPRPLLDAAHG
jgi:hypothetical protein